MRTFNLIFKMLGWEVECWALSFFARSPPLARGFAALAPDSGHNFARVASLIAFQHVSKYVRALGPLGPNLVPSGIKWPHKKTLRSIT